MYPNPCSWITDSVNHTSLSISILSIIILFHLKSLPLFSSESHSYRNMKSKTEKVMREEENIWRFSLPLLGAFLGTDISLDFLHLHYIYSSSVREVEGCLSEILFSNEKLSAWKKACQTDKKSLHWKIAAWKWKWSNQG